ncbi:DUF3450 family protein [Pelagicoccus sp. SDUM812003]|uniref:DUF3450 family protein n=1 Tax=Pelagicoccus sp. SDUM812003 TaxID=3041267 RepID=UPI00280EF5A4|nr:DUF3450 family protein [Pelagicoccus sp. SDUM812003]MDQ8203468.1 DUF3450 family protein [Pelagicoccus sp. SDUM812003]
MPILKSASSLLLALAILAPALLPATELDQLKQKTDKWIDLRTRLAEEKAAWRTDKEVLKTSIETLQSSLSSAEESLAYYRHSIEELEERTSAARLKESAHSELGQQIAQRIDGYEQRLQALSERLPDPLKDKLRSLLAKIPGESEQNVPLPNRLQNVVAIMTTIDEFNQSLTLSHSIRSVDDGNTIEVRALYWGLSHGFATDLTGERAWLLKPDLDGWQWIDFDESSPAIKRIFHVYDKLEDPIAVSVPFQIDLGERQK